MVVAERRRGLSTYRAVKGSHVGPAKVAETNLIRLVVLVRVHFQMIFSVLLPSTWRTHLDFYLLTGGHGDDVKVVLNTS